MLGCITYFHTFATENPTPSPMKLSRLPLYSKILLAMLAGIITGYLFLLFNAGTIITDWIKPWGTIFIKLLKLVAIPLVFVSLIKGVSQMKDISRLSRLGLRTLGTYLITTLIAVTLGITMVSIIKPGSIFPEEKAMELREQHAESMEVRIESARQVTDNGPLRFIVDIIPENLTEAAGDNSKMLQIIFVALLIGVAVITIDSKTAAPITPIIDATNDIILKIVDFIMQFAPIGVFSLMATMIVDFSGDLELFASLGLYALTVVITLFILAFLFYPLMMKLLVKYPIRKFIKGLFPIQLVAFSTSSSAATLPFTMEQSRDNLGISEEVSSFVLPVGATINMDGTSAYQAVAILFIAQIFGMDLTLAQIINIVLLTVLASIGTPGVPGASVVMTVMVLTATGIPIEGLVLILGIDRPLDMIRTVVNVTGDVSVAKWMDQLNTRKN